MKSFWSATHELYESNTPFVVATLISVRGHAPQEPGAKILVTADGLYWGTVGGGKIEAKTIEHSKSLLKKYPDPTPPELYVWNLQKDITMSCGGEVTMLFETHPNASTFRVAIFGAGHVAQALTRTLSKIDCQITCIDHRPEWVEKLENTPKLKKVCIPDLRTYLDELDSKYFFVVMTRGHASDMVVLEAILKKFPDAKYVGCLGSDVKAIKLKSELKGLGIAPSILEKFHSPMGLKLGSNDPYEIAISIAAELIQERDRKPPAP